MVQSTDVHDGASSYTPAHAHLACQRDTATGPNLRNESAASMSIARLDELAHEAILANGPSCNPVANVYEYLQSPGARRSCQHDGPMDTQLQKHCNTAWCKSSGRISYPKELAPQGQSAQ